MKNRARENNLWRWLRGAERHFSTRLHWERIENAAGVGTPDVEGCVDGRKFNLELKSVERRVHIDCELSSEQVMWHRARQRAGGTSYILVQVGSNADAIRYLMRGSDADLLMKSVTEKVLSARSLREVNRPEDVVRSM